ncbi:MAG: hypothetical protein AAB870_02695 [Patescibacteria group bacterium]
MDIKRTLHTIYSKVFLRDRGYMIPLGINVALQLLLWGMVWYYKGVIYQPDREFFALHYKVQYGIDFLAPWYYVLAIPAFGLLIVIMNATLARYGHLHERFGMHVAMIGACVAQVILLWALYLIIQVNIF